MTDRAPASWRDRRVLVVAAATASGLAAEYGGLTFCAGYFVGGLASAALALLGRPTIATDTDRGDR